MRREELYLKDVVGACDVIAQHLQGVDRKTFNASILVQNAVLWQLTVIGEAVARIGEPLKAKYPDIPWRRIKDLRNQVAHNYAGIDLELIWEVAGRDVPLLRVNVAAVIRAEFPAARAGDVG